MPTWGVRMLPLLPACVSQGDDFLKKGHFLAGGGPRRQCCHGNSRPGPGGTPASWTRALGAGPSSPPRAGPAPTKSSYVLIQSKERRFLIQHRREEQ